MKEILRKYIKGECTAAEFKEAIKTLAGFSGQGDLNDFMHWHWVHFKKEGPIGDKNRFSLVLDKIHHRINVEGPKPSAVRRLYAGFARVAAILILPLMVVLGLFLPDYMEKETIAMTTMSTPSGIQSSMDLPDGTKVWLNSESEIRFPASFIGDDKRKVELTGEGYFEVAPNSEKPFIVSAGDMAVKVTGTSFSVSAYANDPQLSVALVEGSVILMDPKNKEEKAVADLEPGEVALYEKGSKNLKISEEQNLDPYVTWKEGRLVFVNEPFSAVLRKMERKYSVVYRLEAPQLLDYRITATFLNETLEEFLKILATSSPVEYEICRPQKGPGNVYERRVVKLKMKK